MEYEKIKQLMEDFGNSKLSKIEIDFPDGTKISMKKQTNVDANINCPQNVTKSIETKITNEEITTQINTEEIQGNIVKSPMVGTFYIKPSPTSDPYVQIGKEVTKGETLCIIEAMKLMNEIESEFSGKITEILVKDGDTVEYGTPLFVIK